MSNYTETSSMGWFGRIKSAFGGLIFGLLLSVGATVLLFWNEGRAVKRYKTLQEGEGAVVTVVADAVDPANEGKLVHVSGVTEVKSGPLTDPLFAVSESGVKLKRTAEMFQWKETKSTKTKKKTGGGSTKTTTYSYKQDWSDKLINSGQFKEKGHKNPTAMPYRSESFVAEKVDLGAFSMPAFLVNKINTAEAVSVDSLEGADAKVKASGKMNEGGVYFGEDPFNPQIGDQKVAFSAVRTGPVSVVAQQVGNSFVVYQAKNGTIDLLTESTKTAAEMFADAHTANKIMTWALRGGGFALMAFGIGLLFKPLSVLADVIPFVGNIVSAGAGFIAMILAGIVSFVTIAIAWIFYRPVLGVTLIVVAIALLVLLIVRIGKKKAEAAQNQGGYAGPTSAPPPLT